MSEDRKMGHVQSMGTYVKVILALVVLTAITVWISNFNFGRLNDVVAMLVAMIKASLVVSFFMHGRYEGKLIWAFIYYPLIILGTLLGALFLDYGTRNLEDRAVIAQPFDSGHHGEEHGSEAGNHGAENQDAEPGHGAAETAGEQGDQSEKKDEAGEQSDSGDDH